jgi:amino acid adenylation domain-containing protein
MNGASTLHALLNDSALLYPDRLAIDDPGRGEITYADLASLCDRICLMLMEAGVRTGDRVGVCARKSIATVASIFAILKSGAAYVPVDASAPAARNALIFADCSVSAAIIERTSVEALVNEFPHHSLTVYSESNDINAFGTELVLVKRLVTADAMPKQSPAVENLAYILYTSGSTGIPKGVMLSHANALAFLNWCSQTFMPAETDRFSSHAPLHFDLSIFDLYMPIKHGAALILFNEETGKWPLQLAPAIAEKRITIWYSTPSILKMLVTYGKLERYDYSALRLVLFAGEVFPIKHLKAIKTAWPRPRYFNLYGPTETNVCTCYEIPPHIPSERLEPFPIGRACSGNRAIVLNNDHQPVSPGDQGELCIAGESVMMGYWNLPEQNEQVFHVKSDGTRWYKTGDIVCEAEPGIYVYIGRRDRMVKRRGYRIELGEVETALYRHPEVAEAAVVALPDEENGVVIKAFLSFTSTGSISIMALKRFCAAHLPHYMIPDRFSVQPFLPKTSTDKIDYQRLMELD